MKNLSFGRFLQLAIEGESHAPSLRFALANFPRDFKLNRDELRAFMSRRAPGRDKLSTARRESDEVNFLSGFNRDFATTGEEIRGEIVNRDQHPNDYGSSRSIPRPGHADLGQWISSGFIPTGGGANSGRLTAAFCAAGAICLQYLATRGITIHATIDEIHNKKESFEDEILNAKKDGDSVGGIISCVATGVRAGIGGHLFDALECSLASAMFAIPGVKGFEVGNGFESAKLFGSENNDEFIIRDGFLATATNRHGGILGGRTTGMPITFRVAMKPTPTIFKSQKSVDLAIMKEANCEIKGRHDPCIVLRAVPVVEAMTAFAIADLLLATDAQRAKICLTLTGETLEENRDAFLRDQLFSDLVELRVDCLRDEERSRVAMFPAMVKVPVVLTFRRECDGGNFSGDEKIRRDFFRSALATKAFAYVDFEDDFRDDELAMIARESRTQIIRSLHDFSRPIANVVERCRELRGETNEIAKIAFMPKEESDVERVFEETKNFTELPHIICAMGELGLATRVSAHRTHSLWTYASSSLAKLGHISPRDIRRAKKFAVIGNPIAHSLSPIMHRANFKALNFIATYEKFEVRDEELGERIQWFRDEGFDGINVTIPHKLAIIPFLDRVDESVKKFGACNTVRFERDGTLTGFNTDVVGFIDSLSSVGFSCRDKRVCIMGRGGAGLAIASCARDEGAKVVEMFGRDKREEAIASAREADLIVNATPVGLKAGEESVLPPEVFRENQVVLDLIPTRDLPPTAKAAKARGATALGGLDFLVAQGAAAFEIWTGLPANRDAMHSRLRE